MYRIVDLNTDTTLANGILELASALELIRLLELDYPDADLSIEQYNRPRC